MHDQSINNCYSCFSFTEIKVVYNADFSIGDLQKLVREAFIQIGHVFDLVILKTKLQFQIKRNKKCLKFDEYRVPRYDF